MESFKLPFVFDAEKILKEISQFNQKDYYDIYNSSVTIETLWSKHLIEPKVNKQGIPVFYPNSSLKKCPYILSILNTFKCDKETYRIHALNAGAKIKPHRDIGYNIEQGKIRIHIPIITHADVLIKINQNNIVMKPGECWYCNFNEVHEVQNNSKITRVHLIIDCLVNDWLLDVFNNN